MEIASVFLKTADLLIKITTSPIAKEIKSIWKYESEIKRFADTVEFIGDVLSDVEAKQFRDASVKRGYKRLREAYLDAEDFLDAVETHRKKLEADTRKFNKTRRFFSGSNPVKHAVKMHNAIKEIMKNLDEIERDMKKFEPKEPIITSQATDLTIYRATGPCVDADKVLGREEDKRKIVDLLISSAADPKKIPVISIVGMGGMGKTTTAQLLYNDESWHESCRFDLKLWVPDSKQFNVKSLLKNILKSISGSDTSLDSLDENHLRKRLVEGIGGKSFLLVLDDVENDDPLIWENLESLLNHGNKEESRILVTTRSRKVADAMGSDSPYELRGLSEKDALQLFERYAFRRGRDEDLVEIGKLVVKKCLGVPLTIRVIGSLLCGKDKCMWERVRRDTELAIKDEKNQIIPILMISYYNLDSTLKQCFSYCALFLKNDLISKQTLSSIWRANVRFKTESETLEDECERNLKTLCDRCLLEEVGNYFGDSYFKMHDLIHDLANKVAGEMFVVNSNAKVNSNKLIFDENVRHVSLMWVAIEDGEFSSFEVKGKRLRTFVQPDSFLLHKMGGSVDELVLDCPVLRLLDIHSRGIKNLTNSIGKLIHLRYLDLSCNKFQTLPSSIVELINLRHLSLAECRALTHLPSGMDALTSLKVLDISKCEQLEELPMGIEKLINLRHLDLSLSNLASSYMTSRMDALSSLEVLCISRCVKLEEQLMGIEKLINLRLLKLAYCWELTHLPAGMGKLTSLEVLDISGGRMLEELPVGIEKLINLKHLNLEGCRSFSHMPSEMGAITSLKVLNISNCEKLKELPVSIEKLTKLKHLILSNCTSLTQMPSGMGALTSLEMLNISYCEKLKELPMSIEKLTRLKHLQLSNCTSLTHMPSGMGSLTSLEILDISRCVKLKELPMGIVKLINLKYLSLEGCKALTHLPTGMGALKSLCTFDKFIVGDPESNHSAQFEELGHLSESIGGTLIIELPNNITLKESLDGEPFLLNKKRLRELEIKWQDNPKEEEPSNHVDILVKLQPPLNLEVFRLNGYQGMTFPPWFQNECLAGNLTKMYISNCGKCQHLPPLSGLPCLRDLELRGLSNLEYIEENVSAASFCPSLMWLKLDYLPELKGWCRGQATGADDDGEHKQSLILPSFPCLSDLDIHSCPNLRVAPILISFVKVFSVNRNAEKDLNMKRGETQSSLIPPVLSSSSVNLFVQLCRNGGGFYLRCYFGQLLELSILDWDASGSQSINMVESFREMSEHLKLLNISNCSGLKTLPGLQHLTALRSLDIKKCCDFTGENAGQVLWKELQCLKALTFIELPKMVRLPEGIQFITSLETLECENCCAFTGEIDGQVSWNDLQSLKELRLTKLSKMERLPEGIQFLTSLQELKIGQCDNLLLPEWLHITFKSKTTPWGYYSFSRVIDRKNRRLPHL